MWHVASSFWQTYVLHVQRGAGYQWWSGAGSDLGELTLIAGALALIKHLNCDAPRCLRYGPHRTVDSQHRLCRAHHPDLPARRLSLREIHERHHAAKREQEP